MCRIRSERQEPARGTNAYELATRDPVHSILLATPFRESLPNLLDTPIE